MKNHSLFLCFFLFLSLTLSLTKTWGRPEKTIVVQAIQDGSFDEASLKTAEILRQKLKETTPLYVVDPKNVDAVLTYYQNYRLSSGLPSAQQAAALLSRAKEHYFQFAYPEAVSELQKNLEIFKNDPQLIFTDGQILLDSYITLGLLHAALRQNDLALKDFQEVFRLDPLFKLDPKAFSPSVQKLWQQAQKNLDLKEMGSIRIEGEPKVAQVFLNGIYQGVSPLTLSSLPPQEYALSFKAHNYQTIQKHLLLKPNQNLVISHKLYWEGPKKEKREKPPPIEEGLRIAELLKVDKVLWVNCEEKTIQTQLIDRQFRAAHKPIVIGLEPEAKGLEEDLDKLVQFVFAQTRLNLLKNPQAHLDPNGLGDPILLGARQKKFPKGILYGGIGVVGLGGILAAILSAGGAASSNTGGVALSFR